MRDAKETACVEPAVYVRHPHFCLLSPPLLSTASWTLLACPCRLAHCPLSHSRASYWTDSGDAPPAKWSRGDEQASPQASTTNPICPLVWREGRCPEEIMVGGLARDHGRNQGIASSQFVTARALAAAVCGSPNPRQIEDSHYSVQTAMPMFSFPSALSPVLVSSHAARESSGRRPIGLPICQPLLHLSLP